MQEVGSTGVAVGVGRRAGRWRGLRQTRRGLGVRRAQIERALRALHHGHSWLIIVREHVVRGFMLRQPPPGTRHRRRCRGSYDGRGEQWRLEATLRREHRDLVLDRFLRFIVLPPELAVGELPIGCSIRRSRQRQRWWHTPTTNLVLVLAEVRGHVDRLLRVVDRVVAAHALLRR